MSRKCDLSECQASMLQLLLFIDKICTKNDLKYWIDGGTLLGSVRHNGFIPWDDDIDICLMHSDYVKLFKILKVECSKHPYYDTYYQSNGIDYWCDYIGDCRILAHDILTTRIDLIPIKAIPDNPDALASDLSLANIANLFIKGKFKNEDDILKEHRDRYLSGPTSIENKKDLFFLEYNAYLTAHSEINEDFLFTYSFNDMLVKKNRRYYNYSEIFPLAKSNFEGYQLSCPNNVDSYLKVLYGDNYMTPPPKDKQAPFAENYYFSKTSKAKTSLHSKIFLEREVKHYKARMQKNKLLWYKEKFISFLSFTDSCIKYSAFSFWWTHFRFVIKKTIYGARF